jgi:transcriptional regulator with PAS, ATPase and Fis domain
MGARARRFDPTAMQDATVNIEDTHSQHTGKTRLILRWLFPDATRPSVPVLHDFTIGRDASCLLLLGGEGVSRVHAKVYRDGGHFVLADNGSTNGTFLRGQPIEVARIQPGAVVRIGTWVGLFESRAEDAALFDTVEELAQGMCGGSTLAQAFEPARRAATSNVPIIVCGETGTGKEVAARAIHGWSGRRGEFCAVNCAALPEQLVEGELFGYRRGAFTGADRNSPGLFRRADRGTLLLDEINELPLVTQAKLLRVLQEQEVAPLGESTPVRVDVRVVVAAQAPLAKAVEEGRFREDLYMRLRGLELVLPPLRERVGDIPALFLRFLSVHAGAEKPPAVDTKLIESLCLYAWPGNVRELELSARRLLAVHGGEPRLKRRFLPAHIAASEAEPSEAGAQDDLARLGPALRRHGGNLSKACAELNISRQRAYRLLDGEQVKEFMARLDKE